MGQECWCVRLGLTWYGGSKHAWGRCLVFRGLTTYQTVLCDTTNRDYTAHAEVGWRGCQAAQEVSAVESERDRVRQAL